MSNYFFLDAEQSQSNATFIQSVANLANEQKEQAYISRRPLTDNKYEYEYKGALILLKPRCKVTIIDFGEGGEPFEDYYEDIIEDVGFISDKYGYKEVLGRPRNWRKELIHIVENQEWDSSFSSYSLKL